MGKELLYTRYRLNKYSILSFYCPLAGENEKADSSQYQEAIQLSECSFQQLGVLSAPALDIAKSFYTQKKTAFPQSCSYRLFSYTVTSASAPLQDYIFHGQL